MNLQTCSISAMAGITQSSTWNDRTENASAVETF